MYFEGLFVVACLYDALYDICVVANVPWECCAEMSADVGNWGIPPVMLSVTAQSIQKNSRMIIKFW